MSGLFGRGGNNSDSNSEPMPLGNDGDKTDIIKTLLNKKISKISTPSNNTDDGVQDFYQPPRNRESMGSSYQSTGSSPRARANTVDEFSDMKITDGLKDSDISELRKDGYKLSNLEKEFDIRHKNDFSNIIKIILVTFSVLVGICFLVIIGIITWTSYKTNSMTETGIIGNFLNFITEIIKIGLS